MAATALRPRAAAPAAIDLESFRHVTAALSRCAMQATATEPAAGERQQRLADAIRANMELWAAVLHTALDGAGTLPAPLRDHLVELAEVSIRHGSHVLRDGAAVEPLIAVNRSIIDGLQLGRGMRAALAER